MTLAKPGDKISAGALRVLGHIRSNCEGRTLLFDRREQNDICQGTGSIENCKAGGLGGRKRGKRYRCAGKLHDAKYDQWHEEEDHQKRAYLATGNKNAPKDELRAKREEQKAYSGQQLSHWRGLNASERFGYP